MVLVIWKRTIQIVREEITLAPLQVTTWVTLSIQQQVYFYNAPSYRQDSICHCLCYTSLEALAGTRSTSMGSPSGIQPTINIKRIFLPDYPLNDITIIKMFWNLKKYFISPHQELNRRPITPKRSYHRATSRSWTNWTRLLKVVTMNQIKK